MKRERESDMTSSSFGGDNHPVLQALRAADEVAAALQAHLTQEHGAAVEDRAASVAPSLDLLRHARVRISAGLRDVERRNRRPTGDAPPDPME